VSPPSVRSPPICNQNTVTSKTLSRSTENYTLSPKIYGTSWRPAWRKTLGPKTSNVTCPTCGRSSQTCSRVCVASRRRIGRSFLTRSTGRMPAATLAMRVGPRSVLPAVIPPIHRRASIGTTKILSVRPVPLSGRPSLRQDEILLFTASILHHAHLWLRNPMTVDSLAGSWRLLDLLLTSEISVLDPLLPPLRHDTFQRMATPFTRTMRGLQAQGCR